MKNISRSYSEGSLKLVRASGLPLLVICLFFILLMPSSVLSSNFSISPTSLDLSGSVKSGVFTVINSDTEKINCQVSLKVWSQDAEGKDVYSDTQEVVFFPKIMTIEPNEQRAIRIGIKGPFSAKEKTYRLFVEEIPAQQKTTVSAGSGKISAGLTIAFRYAVPIFVKPIRQQETAVIEKLEMSKGVVKAAVSNTGNVHIKLLSVKFIGKGADGTELFSKDIAGWYVLHGISKAYEVAVPREICGRLSTIQIRAQSEGSEFNGSLNITKGMCPR